MAAIRYNRFYTDCRDAVLAILRTCIVQYNGGDNFVVYEGLPEVEKVNQSLNYVYFYRPSGADGEPTTVGCEETKDYTFRVGVQRKCGTGYTDKGLESRFWEQVDNLGDQFSAHWRRTAYNFTIQGDTITDLTQIGIREVTRTPDLHVKNGNVEYLEFGVTFKIFYSTTNLRAA